MNELLTSIVGSANATMMSVTGVVLVYVLGRYADLARHERPDREMQQYRYPGILLLVLFWASILSFGLLLLAIILQEVRVLLGAIIVFVVTVGFVAIGLTWLTYEHLSTSR